MRHRIQVNLVATYFGLCWYHKSHFTFKNCIYIVCKFILKYPFHTHCGDVYEALNCLDARLKYNWLIHSFFKYSFLH